MLALARGLDVDVVAEGVETVEQARELMALGCRYAQGYYFAKPLSVADIEVLLGQKCGRTAPERRVNP